jgi:hypothetical protein
VLLDAGEASTVMGWRSDAVIVLFKLDGREEEEEEI